jgi:hypothetical protein
VLIKSNVTKHSRKASMLECELPPVCVQHERFDKLNNEAQASDEIIYVKKGRET